MEFICVLIIIKCFDYAGESSLRVPKALLLMLMKRSLLGVPSEVVRTGSSDARLEGACE